MEFLLDKFIDIFLLAVSQFIFCCQATNEVISQVPEATNDEMEAAVASCREAFKEWSQTTVLTRQQMMFKLQQLVKTNLV